MPLSVTFALQFVLYQDRGPCLFRKVPIKQQKHNREIPSTFAPRFRWTRSALAWALAFIKHL